MNALEIKKRRKELGLTQAGLAKKLGVSLKTVGNYEKGGEIPETKQALLLEILSNKTLLVPRIKNQKNEVYNEKLIEIKEKIKTRNDYLLDLENTFPINISKIEHQKEIISILELRLSMLTDSISEIEEDTAIDKILTK